MTFRPPATKQKTRRRQLDTRRSIYTNIAFGLAILAAVALLSGVLLGNYYSEHWTPVASVNGVAITKDDVRDRANVDLAIFQRQIDNYGTLRNQAKIASDEYSTIAQTITGQEDPSTLYSTALTELKDDLAIEQYASKNGISVSDADVEAQIVKDSTIPELRHVEIIATDAVPTPPAPVPTAQQVAEAKTRLEGYLNEVKSGTKWDDVYTESTQDGAVGQVGTNSGDLGLQSRDDLSALDPDLLDAIFALQNVNDLTPIFKGDDGIFRFATVTKIVPAYVDPGWKDAIGQAASGDAYRSKARGEALTAAVRKSVEQKYISSPTVMRHVEEVFIQPAFLGSPGEGTEYKFKLMVMAPNHDESAASSLAATDPAWAAAEQRAEDAVAKLRADPSQFATMAKDTNINDDQYFNTYGGDVPWLPSVVIYDATGQAQATLNMPALLTALSSSVTEPGIMAPILESSVGYLVVQFEGSRPSPEQRIADAQLLLATGTSFSTAVQDFSEAGDAFNGGDMGWIGRYSLQPALEQAVFSTPVGGISQMVSDSGGYWIFKVLAEETRTGDQLEQEKLKKSLWSLWQADLNNAANIWTDSDALTAITPTAAP
jgi:hypothetical protein